MRKTVAQIIAELQQQPPDAEVKNNWTYDGDDMGIIVRDADGHELAFIEVPDK